MRRKQNLLGLAGTTTCDHSQPQNYPRQYLHQAEEISWAPAGPIGRLKLPIHKFSPPRSPSGPQDKQTTKLQQMSGAGRPIPILFQDLKTTVMRNSPSAKFRWEQAHACFSSGKKLISFFLLQNIKKKSKTRAQKGEKIPTHFANRVNQQSSGRLALVHHVSFALSYHTQPPAFVTESSKMRNYGGYRTPFTASHPMSISDRVDIIVIQGENLQR